MVVISAYLSETLQVCTGKLPPAALTKTTYLKQNRSGQRFSLYTPCGGSRWGKSGGQRLASGD